MQVVKGDLFKSGERIIAHGCNCVGLMGAGVAAIVRNQHPVAYKRYLAAINAGVFNIGYAQFVLDEDNDRCIYNLATQHQPGKNATEWGVYLSFCNMLEHAKANHVTRIALPKIGSGIGGLDWDKQVIPSILAAKRDTRTTVELVVYEL